MRFAIFAVALAGVAHAALVTNIKHVFHAQVDIAPKFTINGYSGQRVSNGVTGGNFTKNNQVFATIVPGYGGDNGYIDPKGVFHPDGRYTIKFVEDSKYGFVTLSGIKTSTPLAEYLHFTIETDSTSAAAVTVNDVFIVVNASLVGSTLQMDAYVPFP